MYRTNSAPTCSKVLDVSCSDCGKWGLAYAYIVDPRSNRVLCKPCMKQLIEGEGEIRYGTIGVGYSAWPCEWRGVSSRVGPYAAVEVEDAHQESPHLVDS